MHSSLVRIQNVFGFFTTVVFCVGVLVALTSLVSPSIPSAKLELRNVQVVKGRPHYYSTKKEEYAHIKFDLDGDLTTLFSWNTKQVFAYVTAVFPSQNPSSPPSEAVIWDAIIPHPSAPWHQNTYIHPTPKKSTAANKRKVSSKKKGVSEKEPRQAYPPGAEPGILKLSNQRPKYQITTPWAKIGGLENCTLHLRYNIQPWVGALVWSSPDERGVWMGLEGESSAAFSMPEVKGAKGGDGQQASKSLKEELRTETGAERNRGSPA